MPRLVALVHGMNSAAAVGDLSIVPAEGFHAALAPIGLRSRILQGRRRRLRDAADYQRQLESLLPLGTVIPVLPDTEARPEQIPLIVNANRPALAYLTERLAGKVQYQVTVSWAAEKVLSDLRNEPEIAPLFQASRVGPSVLEAAVNRLAFRMGDQIEEILGQGCAELLGLPRGTDTLFNGVALVETGLIPDFEAAVERVDTLWSEGLLIRQVGPAAACSFASIGLNQIDLDTLRKAETRFELPPGWTHDDLRIARQRKLRSTTERSAPQASDDVRMADYLASWAQVEKCAAPLPQVYVWSEDRAMPPEREECVA